MQTDNVQAVIDTALRSATPAPLELGKFYTVVMPGGGVQKIDLTGEEHTGFVTRKRGTATLQDVPSFLHYWGKHSDTDSEIYADQARLTVTAVLDAHTADTARWGQHRAVLALRPTAAWTAWTNISAKSLSQTDMAEFLEDHLPEIVTPSGAEMLELVQTFQATIKAEFKSSSILASGARQISYAETINATAGKKGELTIPGSIALGIAPFEGSDPYEITARFRTRIADDRLFLAIKLDRPEDVIRAAFADTTQLIAETTGEGSVLTGTPIG